MSTLNALIGIFAFVLFVLVSVGLHNLQMWLEADSNNWRRMSRAVNLGRSRREAELSSAH